ncbi:MAG: sterol desaturase family protein [Crocinitomicaceae bacterium]|nr:sterol desaturase family protein [Crocinitomicaceae bacterium]
MDELVHIVYKSYRGYGNYLWKTITNPFPDHGVNFFYLLIVVSLLVWGLELLAPWRKNQKPIRQDFWIDAFYMFFNFFIFNLILFIALSNTTAHLFGKLMGSIGLPEEHILNVSHWPQGLQLLTYFILYDFVQWSVHTLLHRIPFLWNFHKLHHSVQEMGFSAHLRFHFFELFVYKPVLFIVLSYLFNFSLEQAFIIHIFAITIGHLNHANLGWDYGPLKYIINNPKMHIWHHAKELPDSHPNGINFGISLSIWDYIFGTKHIPESGRDIALGFHKVEEYPSNFFKQQVKPFSKTRKTFEEIDAEVF